MNLHANKSIFPVADIKLLYVTPGKASASKKLFDVLTILSTKIHFWLDLPSTKPIFKSIFLFLFY